MPSMTSLAASRGRLTERHNSDTWADFLADLQSEVECPQPDASTD
jgi:hypothetical protein